MSGQYAVSDTIEWSIRTNIYYLFVICSEPILVIVLNHKEPQTITFIAVMFMEVEKLLSPLDFLIVLCRCVEEYTNS